jgi:hypothetical protein
MSNVEHDIATACETAARRAVADFGETLLKWWPAAMASGLRDQLAGSARSALTSGITNVLGADLLGANVFDAGKVAWSIPGPPATSVTCPADLSQLASGGQSASQSRSFNAQTSFPVTLPPFANLAATISITVQVAGELPGRDEALHAKTSVRLAASIAWTFQTE